LPTENLELPLDQLRDGLPSRGLAIEILLIDGN